MIIEVDNRSSITYTLKKKYMFVFRPLGDRLVQYISTNNTVHKKKTTHKVFKIKINRMKNPDTSEDVKIRDRNYFAFIL